MPSQLKSCIVLDGIKWRSKVINNKWINVTAITIISMCIFDSKYQIYYIFKWNFLFSAMILHEALGHDSAMILHETLDRFSNMTTISRRFNFYKWFEYSCKCFSDVSSLEIPYHIKYNSMEPERQGKLNANYVRLNVPAIQHRAIKAEHWENNN